MGEYTSGLGPGGFEGLPARVGKDLHFVEAVSGYFDDLSHFTTVRQITALHCRLCEEDPQKNRAPPQFNTLVQLKTHILRQHKLHMCDICLEGRKVFVSEQALYSKQDLDRHNAGCSHVDKDSELGHSSFKGHPQCGFCRKRFYSDGELYSHMQRDHFTCHICQRAEPDKFVYYADYPKLEEHFRASHHLCEDPQCLAKKFVVFQTEQEHKRHNAQEHGGNMSKAQRREALNIPVQLNFRSYADERPPMGRGRTLHNNNNNNNNNNHNSGSSGSLALDMERARVASLASAASAMHHARSEPDVRQLEDPAQAPQDFPALLPTSSGAAASTGSHRWAHTAGSQHSVADFPALPSSSSSNQRPKSARPGSSRAGGGRGSASMAETLGGSRAGRRPAAAAHPEPASAGDRGVTPAAVSSEEWGPPLPSSSRPPPGFGRGRGRGSIALTRSPGSRRPGTAANYGVADQSAAWSAASEEGGRDADGDSAAELQMSPEQLKAANKALVDKMHGLLGNDASKFQHFKELSSRFRHGGMPPAEYHAAVAALGLSSLVSELASLCPDAGLRRELLKAHAHASKPEPAAAAEFTAVGPAHRRPSAPPGFSQPIPSLDAHPGLSPSKTSSGSKPAGAGTEAAAAAGASRAASGGKKGKGKEQGASQDASSAIAQAANTLFGNGGASGAGALSDGQWSCAVCTLHNASSSLRCAACMSPKPHAGLTAAPANGEDPGKGRKGKKGKKGMSIRLTGGVGDAFSALEIADDRGTAWGS